MELIIDDREKAVVEHIGGLESKYDILVDRIEVGDYCVVRDGEIILCIERKTWADLGASIKDGRTKNMGKMLALREKTGCHLFYLIEGSPFHAPTRKFAGIEFRSLLAHLDHCQLRDQISVIYSKNIVEVVPRIIMLMNNYGTFLPSKVSIFRNGGEKSQVGLLKERRVSTEKESLIDLWTCLSGVSFKTAEVLVEAGVTVGAVYLRRVSIDAVAELRYANGSALGMVRAKKLFSDVNNRETTILSRVRGVSKATAALILKSVSFADIVSGAATAAQLAEVRLSSRRLGSKLAEHIVRLLALDHKGEVGVVELVAAAANDGLTAAVARTSDDDADDEEDEE